MTFDKCTINGRVYGELLDEDGNSIDITEVSIGYQYTTVLMLIFFFFCLTRFYRNVFMKISYRLLVPFYQY